MLPELLFAFELDFFVKFIVSVSVLQKKSFVAAIKNNIRMLLDQF